MNVIGRKFILDYFSVDWPHTLDKGQEIVILERTKYIEKFMNLIYLGQFRESENNPTKGIKTKLQNLPRNLKNNKNLSEQDYKRIYLKSRIPGLFYGTTKV